MFRSQKMDQNQRCWSFHCTGARNSATDRLCFSAAFYSEESNARLNGKLPQPELSFVILSAVAMVAVALAALIIFAWLNDGGYSHAYLFSSVCALNAGQFIQPGPYPSISNSHFQRDSPFSRHFAPGCST
jgi:hypothetical protein